MIDIFFQAIYMFVIETTSVTNGEAIVKFDYNIRDNKIYSLRDSK